MISAVCIMCACFVSNLENLKTVFSLLLVLYIRKDIEIACVG